jgi:hypothetical protein
MNLTEDQLRSALHETGEEVSPTQVPPLRLPADTARWRLRLPGVPARRWLPAAAAVTAVLAVAAVLGVLAGGARPARPAGAGPLAQLPPYYVALRLLPGPAAYAYRDEAVVRSTVSGRDVAVVAAPKGYQGFLEVSGSDTGLTFVLSAATPGEGLMGRASKLYLLRVRPSAPAGDRAVLSALPAPTLPRGSLVSGFALSPDGRMLAVSALQPRGLKDNGPNWALEVSNLATGTHRRWATLGNWDLVSWSSDDRTLELQSPQVTQLMLLDTAAPGTTIAADARAVIPQTRPGTQLITGSLEAIVSSFGSGTMTADGEHVLEMVSPRHESSGSTNGRRYGLDVLDLRTGTITRLLQHVPSYDILWSNRSGSAALVIYALSNPLNSLLKDVTKPTYAVLRSARGTGRVEFPPATWEVAW